VVFRSGFRKRDELRRLRIERRRVDQGRTDTEGALLHRLAYQRLHLFEFRLRGIAVFEADDVLADRGRANEGRNVDRDALVLEELEILAERGPFNVVTDVALAFLHDLLERVVPRSPGFTLAEDLERHALPNIALRPAVLDQRADGPAEHVDESR